MATFKFVLIAGKIKLNGKAPIFLRITEHRKQIYTYAGFDVNPKEWDANTGMPINERLSKHLTYRLLNIKIDYAEGKSITQIRSDMSGKIQIDFEQAFSSLYENEKLNSPRNAEAWKTAVSRYRTILDIETLAMEDFTAENISDFKDSLMSAGKSINTISVYTRGLRAVYKRICKKMNIVPKKNPFPSGSVPRPASTAKRSISKDNLLRIYELKMLDSKMAYYRDVWMLLYCLGGVDVLDLAQMKKPSGDYIYFRRKKSRGRGDEVKIYVTPQAAAIMEKYPHKDRLISGIEYTSVNQYRDLLKEMNLMMNKLSIMAGMSEKLTSKVARHTFATIARNMRYDRELIGVLMGHRQKNVTDIYIMYSQEMIDDALKDVISTSLSHH